jgi:hypothetical protein
MADEVEVVTKSPQELFDEKRAAEEALLAAKIDYDPKKHGAGTQPVTTPETVVHLHKLHLALEARVQAIEDRMKPRR